jgi:hypothetical protein
MAKQVITRLSHNPQVPIDLKIPDDYLEHPGFKACFGYIYLAELPQVKPTQFNVKFNDYWLIDGGEDTCLVCFYAKSYQDTLGLVTIEGSLQEILKPINKAKKRYNPRDSDRPIPWVSFVAKPRYDKRFIDDNGLKVVPFWLEKKWSKAYKIFGFKSL